MEFHTIAALTIWLVLAQGEPELLEPLDPESSPPPQIQFAPARDIAEFTSSDALLEETWAEAKKRALESAGDRAFDMLYRSDGPIRAEVAALCRSWLWIDAEGALVQEALSTVLHPRIMAEGGSFADGHNPLAEYTLIWPELLLRYVQYTGDTSYGRSMARGVLPIWREHFAARETESGLLSGENMPSYTERTVDIAGNASPEPDAILNAFYYNGLKTAAEASRVLDLDYAPFDAAAERLQDAYRATFLDEATGLVRQTESSDSSSYAATALAMCFGLKPAETRGASLDWIREQGLDCDPLIAPYVVEACFIAGDHGLGYELLTTTDSHLRDTSPVYLINEYVLGIRPGQPGWRVVDIQPAVDRRIETAHLTIPVRDGRVTARYEYNVGMRVTVPPGTTANVRAARGVGVMVNEAISHATGELSQSQWALLESKGWSERVGDQPAVWISVDDQMLRLIEGRQVVFQARCATAEKGVGSENGSLQTPLGWHSVVRKVGGDAPWGEIFRARIATKRQWRPGDDTTEDLVLSRILLLGGEEPGLNKGGNVDSYARNIYIHGTNDEARIGVPSSHGCIRLTNDDVIDAYARIPEDTLVLITLESDQAGSQ